MSSHPPLPKQYFKMIPIDELKEYPFLRYTEQEIKPLIEDILKNGLKEPLQVHTHKNCKLFHITDGRHRVQVLKRLGWKEVPCMVTEEEL
jgi:ParB-like chromosome segregation protein Spo0J